MLTPPNFSSKLTNWNLTFWCSKTNSHLICSIQMFQQTLQLQKRWCRRRNDNITSCLRFLQPFFSCFQCNASISWTVTTWPGNWTLSPVTSMATHMAAGKACAGTFLVHHGAAILCTVQTAAEPDVFGSEKPTIGCVRDMDLKSKVNKCSPTGSPRFGSQTCSELLKMKTTGENSCY